MHAQFPGKLLAYNCSPSFNWSKHLDGPDIAGFQRDLGAMGYAFQFVTLAGGTLSTSPGSSSPWATPEGMRAYVVSRSASSPPRAMDTPLRTRHQREVGAGYFDDVMTTLTNGVSSTLALVGSTESEQFSDLYSLHWRLNVERSANVYFATRGGAVW